MADLTCVAANLHNEVAAVRAVDALRPDVAMLCEVNHRGRELVGLTGYHYLTGALPGPSREVGILVSKRVKHLRLLGTWHEFVSAAAARYKRVGKERWGHVALVEVEGVRVACVALHPVAGPKVLSGFDPDHLLARRYASAMRWLEQTVAYHRGRGHEVILGADIQMRETWERPWSPHAIFAEHNMATYWPGIDVLAFTRGLSGLRTETRDVGSDHPALRAELNVKQPKRRK